MIWLACFVPILFVLFAMFIIPLLIDWFKFDCLFMLLFCFVKEKRVQIVGLDQINACFGCNFARSRVCILIMLFLLGFSSFQLV